MVVRGAYYGRTVLFCIENMSILSIDEGAFSILSCAYQEYLDCVYKR